MSASNDNAEAMKFVRQLARELSSGDVKLPSLPDVVIKIRKLLEEENCDFDQVAKVVSADPILVSRLLVFANSAAYNSSGENIKSLETAISRLGFELVRNTAITLAIKQLFLGEKHKAIAKHIRELWAHSMQLSSLAHAVAETHKSLNEETAYLCGLMHHVGKLYILSKARDYPKFLGDATMLQAILLEWHTKVGKSILEAWDFPDDVCESVDPAEYLDEHTHLDPTMVDVMFVAESLLASAEGEAPDFASMPSCVKLGIDEETAGNVLEAYREKLQSVQDALSQAA